MNHSSKTPLFLYRALYVDPLSLSQTDLLEKLRPFMGTYGPKGPGEAQGPRPWSPMTPPFKEYTVPLLPNHA